MHIPRTCFLSRNCVYYDLRQFMEFIYTKDRKWHDRLEEFATALDKKVGIDRDESNYKPLYDKSYDTAYG